MGLTWGEAEMVALVGGESVCPARSLEQEK